MTRKEEQHRNTQVPLEKELQRWRRNQVYHSATLRMNTMKKPLDDLSETKDLSLTYPEKVVALRERLINSNNPWMQNHQ